MSSCIYQIKFIIKHCNKKSQTITMMYDCSIIIKRKLWSYLELITFLLWVSKLIVKMQGEISLLEYQSTWNVTPRVAIRNMSKMLKYRYHHHYFVLLWMYYCSHGQAGNNNFSFVTFNCNRMNIKISVRLVRTPKYKTFVLQVVQQVINIIMVMYTTGVM